MKNDWHNQRFAAAMFASSLGLSTLSGCLLEGNIKVDDPEHRSVVDPVVLEQEVAAFRREVEERYPELVSLNQLVENWNSFE